MTEHLTAPQIQARLEGLIALHPGCRDFRVEVSIRRVDPETGTPGDWSADFLATGDAHARDACEQALLEILENARDDYTMSLDS